MPTTDNKPLATTTEATATPAPEIVTKVQEKKPAPKTEAKPAAKPVAKPVAKAPTKTVAKAAAKPVKKAAAKPVTQPVAKPAAKVKKVAAPKPEKEKKIKMVRDSISIPKTEYVVLDTLKLRAAKLATPAKKTEILRAGIKALATMSDTAFLAAIRSVPNLKTGRPAKVA